MYDFKTIGVHLCISVGNKYLYTLVQLDIHMFFDIALIIRYKLKNVFINIKKKKETGIYGQNFKAF